MDLTSFIGRLHPLMVHLPVGFILLGLIFQWASGSDRLDFLRRSVPLIYFLAVLTSVLSVIMGLFLADLQAYPPSTLLLHKWMAFSTTFLAGLLFFLTFRAGKFSTSLIKVLSIVLLVALILTGHFGGILTHGNGYLSEYAPAFAKGILEIGEPGHVSGPAIPADPDSIIVWDHLVKPIMESKCAMCHMEGEASADLVLNTKDGLLQGSSGGSVAEAGHPEDSELFKRVSMDPTAKKFMPPNGIALSFNEVKLLEYWIAEGLPFEENLSSISDEMKDFIQENFGISARKRSYVDIVPVDPAPVGAVEDLKGLGYSIRRISASNNYLDVQFNDEISEEELRALFAVGEQVSWLDLGATSLEDKWVPLLGSFPNLTKLGLQNNSITGLEFSALVGLEHLESINLYQTQIGAEQIRVLSGIPSLRSVYVWNTLISEEELESLREELPNLEIR